MNPIKGIERKKGDILELEVRYVNPIKGIESTPSAGIISSSI